MKYRILIDDNFRFMDESERVAYGTFETAEDAVSACRRVIDEWLADAFKPGMTSEGLWQSYIAFGDDPFITPVDQKDAPAANFDAWAYARERCAALAGGAPSV